MKTERKLKLSEELRAAGDDADKQSEGYYGDDLRPWADRAAALEAEVERLKGIEYAWSELAEGYIAERDALKTEAEHLLKENQLWVHLLAKAEGERDGLRADAARYYEVIIGENAIISELTAERDALRKVAEASYETGAKLYEEGYAKGYGEAAALRATMARLEAWGDAVCDGHGEPDMGEFYRCFRDGTEEGDK